jgi:Trypsin
MKAATRRFLRVLAHPQPLAALLCLCLTSHQAPAENDIEMLQLSDQSGVEPQLINGHKVADAKKWSATALYQTDAGDNCTATVVGERALITAAHCLRSGARATIVYDVNRYELSCEHHPDYDDRPRNGGIECHLMKEATAIAPCTADVAICLVDPKHPFPTDRGAFERVKKEPPGATAGRLVTLLGFGCTVKDGKISSALYVGDSLVEYTSTPGVSRDHSEKAYLEYIRTGGPAALCDGDSGGAAYSTSEPGSREIVGIGSRGNLSSISYLVNVLDSRITDWMVQKSHRDHFTICGLSPDASNCQF